MDGKKLIEDLKIFYLGQQISFRRKVGESTGHRDSYLKSYLEIDLHVTPRSA